MSPPRPGAVSASPAAAVAEEFKYPSVIALQEEIKCPVCLRLPRKSPVYQCISGHILCKECHQRCEDTCPTCRRPLHGKIRSIVADKLLDLMPVLCRYNDHGCEVETHRDEIDTHESACDCRPVCCVDIACHAKVPVKKMLQHMTTEHEREDFVHANGPKYRVRTLNVELYSITRASSVYEVHTYILAVPLHCESGRLYSRDHVDQRPPDPQRAPLFPRVLPHGKRHLVRLGLLPRPAGRGGQLLDQH